MMTWLRFNEEELTTRLGSLPRSYRIAFAAACAQRLLPAYFLFASETGIGNPGSLSDLLAEVWDSLCNGSTIDREVASMVDLAMELIPQYDHDPVPIMQPLAEDAGAAVAYTLRCFQNGDPKESAWSGRCAYEALDYWVIALEREHLHSPRNDEQLLKHPLIQEELNRQRRDVEELTAAIEGDRRSIISAIRERAIKEGKVFGG